MRLRLRDIPLEGINQHGKRGGKLVLKTRTDYLARIGSQLFLGRFHKQWYGWSFDDGWGASGHQFDPPGINRSKWKQLWEIVKFEGENDD